MRVRTIVLLGIVHTALASIASTKKDVNTDTYDKTTTVKPGPAVKPVPTVKPVTKNISVTSVTKNEVVYNGLNLLKVDGRRKKARDRSTSSSSGEKGGASKSSADRSSLDLSSSGSDSEDKSRKEKYKKYENKDAVGWRRWHRKCTPCPDDMVKKWRDPTIKWICGGYQRARRSFKSECMMHYRNCQDGTMFVKIHDHRCNNATGGYNRGRHFFYDYKVTLPDDSSSNSETSSSTSSEESSSDPDIY